MAQNLELALRMRADLQQARRQLQQVEAELEDVARGGGKAGQGMRRYTQETDKAERSSRRMAQGVGQLRNLLVTLGAGLALRQMVRYTDTITGLESQLRLVTGSQEELAGSFADLYRLANETRQGLEPTVNLYARMARATEELDVSHQDLLTVTKAISQAMLISGASTQESASAMLQLSQGMASGTLRGEELNSVLENSPRLAQAIADGLRVNMGKLRQMGADGELTAERLLNAFMRTADGIEREAQTMERTVGQALQQLRNDLLVTFGGSEVDGFTEAIDALRDVVTDPGFQQSMVTLGTAVANLVGAMAQGISTGTNFTAWAAEELAALSSGVAGDDVVRLEQQADEIRKLLDTPSRSLAGQGNRLRFFGPTGVVEYWDDDELKAELARIEGQIEDYWANRPAITIPITGQRPEDEETPPPTPPGGGGGGSSGPSEAAKAYQAALNSLMSLESGMQQQIATFGEGEAAVLEYRLTVGDLADDVARLGAEGQALAAGIVEQAREIERLTEAEEARAEAQQQRQQAEQQAAENLQRVLDQVDPARALERQLELIEELKTQFPQYAEALDQAAGQVKARIDDINQGLLSARNINAEFAYGATDGVMAFAEGIANGENAVDSFADAFRQFASDFLLYIARMIAQQAIFNAMQSMGGNNSGGGGIGGLIAGALGALTGGGGASAGGLYANVAAYHGGGVIDGGMAGSFRGLAPDEVPAVFRRGEEVLTASDPRHRNNQGAQGSPNVSVKNVNVFDAADVLEQAMADTAGQKVMLNYVKSNSSAFRSALGV